MDTSYLSILSFLLITWAYYYVASVGKIQLEMRVNEVDKTIPPVVIGKGGLYETYEAYNSANMGSALIFLLMVVLTQLGLNIYSVIDKCGGSVGKNIGVSLLLTVVPWTIILGGVIGLLMAYPGLKSAFADVIGYYIVSTEANDIIGTIITESKVDEEIEKVKNSNESHEMKRAAEAVMKMCGNKGVLVNSMNPSNFEQMWKVLTPLMVKEVDLKTSPNNKDNKILNDYKSDLFNLVVKKDNIGEGMWYIYTGLLVTSIVSYNLATRTCSKDSSKTEADHEEYLKTVEELDKEKELNQSGEPYSA